MTETPLTLVMKILTPYDLVLVQKLFLVNHTLFSKKTLYLDIKVYITKRKSQLIRSLRSDLFLGVILSKKLNY